MCITANGEGGPNSKLGGIVARDGRQWGPKCHCRERSLRGTRRNPVVFSLATIQGAMWLLTFYYPQILRFFMDKNKNNLSPNLTKGSGSPSGEARIKDNEVSKPSDLGSNVEAQATGSAPQGDNEGKPLTKSMKRRLRRIEKKKSLNAGEETPSTSSKRSRQEEVTPSSASRPPAKRAKDDNRPILYSRVAAENRLAIIKKGYPKAKMNDEEMEIINRHIIKLINSTEADDELPSIGSFILRTGAIILNCEDEMTCRWIRSKIDGNSSLIKDNTLSVLKANELPKPIRVAFRTKDIYTKDANELLKRMARFNKNFKCTEWRVINKLIDPHSIRWIFEVDQEAADAIKAADFSAKTGLDRGWFKILTTSPQEPAESEKSQPEELSNLAGATAMETEETVKDSEVSAIFDTKAHSAGSIEKEGSVVSVSSVTDTLNLSLLNVHDDSLAGYSSEASIDTLVEFTEGNSST